MTLSHYFIDRPVLASVISIVTVVVGGLAIFMLPIAQYPEIVPPTVVVTAHYPGASAKVVADTVATPIEEQINGVENMLYMSSQSTNDGTLTLTITFKLGTNLTSPRCRCRTGSRWPSRFGCRGGAAAGNYREESSPDLTLSVTLFHRTTPRTLYLSNYATLQVRDQLARLPGVGDTIFSGARIIPCTFGWTPTSSPRGI